jgi:hypothetical protein
MNEMLFHVRGKLYILSVPSTETHLIHSYLIKLYIQHLETSRQSQQKSAGFRNQTIPIRSVPQYWKLYPIAMSAARVAFLGGALGTDDKCPGWMHSSGLCALAGERFPNLSMGGKII